MNQEPKLTGLSAGDVSCRIQEGKVNTPVKASSDSTLSIVCRNVFTYFNFIFFFLAALVIMVGSYKDLMFLGVIIVNTMIGIVQEIRSRNTLAKISLLNSPKTVVLRDGLEQEILSEQVVEGDILKLTAGCQICADAVVLEGDLSVNEALLTGEADEIRKVAGSELMSGSFVVAGSCYARADRVGAQSYASRLTAQARVRHSKSRSKIVRALNRLLLIMGIAIVPIAASMLYVSIFVTGDDITEAVVSMVAAIIGMIPEGLFLLTTVALAVSVMRLAEGGVLTHDLACIEMLARVDVLCLDKTGTITENIMQVSSVLALDGYSGSAEELPELFGTVLKPLSPDNLTMRTLQLHFNQGKHMKPSLIVPFSSGTKYSGVCLNGISYVLGAPDILMGNHYESIEEQLLPYTAGGSRALLLGTVEEMTEEGFSGNVSPLAAVFLENPIRKGTEQTFSYFYDQGVDIRVISGDNPVTVSHIASEAGIRNAKRYIDASVLNDTELAQAAADYTVFGRVSPEQKKLLVKALQAEGHTVAMTGDGVNDVPALKLADCSIAMASGTEAAASASQLVLVNSDFSCMPRVVDEGRRVINNIERSASLFLVKNIFSLLLALYAIVTGLIYPLAPSQLSLVSLFAIGIPSFFLALEPNRDMVKGEFIPNIISRALPAGLINFLLVGTLVFVAPEFTMSSGNVSTASMFILAVVEFMFLFQMCRPFNRMRFCMYLCVTGGFLLTSVLFGSVLGLSVLSKGTIILVILMSVTANAMFRFAHSFNLNTFLKWIREE